MRANPVEQRPIDGKKRNRTDLTQEKYDGLAWPAKLNAWRVIPRVLIFGYTIVFVRTVEWFMMLPEPNMAQAGLVSTVVGAGAGFFGLYVNSGGRRG